MNIALIGMTIQTIGELFIAYTVLRVHHRVLAEHDIDAVVMKEMRFEQTLGILGMIFILSGFLLDAGATYFF